MIESNNIKSEMEQVKQKVERSEKLLSNLTSEKEKAILKQLESFSDVVNSAAKELAPHIITNYVHNLAELIHAWYNDAKIIDRDNLDISKSRLALCKASKQVIKNALWLVGVNAPSHM